jgi:hypothetical protein
MKIPVRIKADIKRKDYEDGGMKWQLISQHKKSGLKVVKVAT